MRVDAAAHGRSADGQFQDCLDCQVRAVHRAVQLPGHAADLLAEGQRRGVDEVRAADLEHLFPFLGLGRQGRAALVQGRNEPLPDRHGHRHVDRGGEHVVGALAHVHVVVGMDRLLGVEAVAAGQFDRPVGDHLVDVHVGRGARAGLINVQRELVVELAGGHLAGGGQQGLDLLVVQGILARAGEFAQVAVGAAAAHFTRPKA